MSSLVARGWPRNPRPQEVAGIRAPCIWRVLAIETAITAGQSGPVVKYRWQRPLVIVHARFLTTSGLDADLAALTMTWEDGEGEQVVTSGLASQGVPLFGLSGAKYEAGMWSKYVPLEIPVRHNDVHTFQVTNNHATRAITPILLFHCVERATL